MLPSDSPGSAADPIPQIAKRFADPLCQQRCNERCRQRGISLRTDELYYFAYGSNMHPARLRERTPSCQRIGVATLPGHVLRFNHVSTTDGSAKCNVLATGIDTDVVHGVVYSIPATERAALDAAEDLGVGYRLRHLQVHREGCGLCVFCYVAVEGTIDNSSRPFRWYRDIVLHGARQHAFPEDYLAAIAAEQVVEDPDPVRTVHHRRLLKGSTDLFALDTNHL